MQWILLLVLMFVIYTFFIRRSPRSKKGENPATDTMVECAACGVFVSQKEAIIKEGQFFCSKECTRIR